MLDAGARCRTGLITQTARSSILLPATLDRRGAADATALEADAAGRDGSELSETLLTRGWRRWLGLRCEVVE